MRYQRWGEGDFEDDDDVDDGGNDYNNDGDEDDIIKMRIIIVMFEDLLYFPVRPGAIRGLPEGAEAELREGSEPGV